MTGKVNVKIPGIMNAFIGILHVTKGLTIAGSHINTLINSKKIIPTTKDPHKGSECVMSFFMLSGVFMGHSY